MPGVGRHSTQVPLLLFRLDWFDTSDRATGTGSGRRIIRPFFLSVPIGRITGSAKPDFWKRSPVEKYSLVICSAVLTQLQASVRSRVEKVFLDKFPGHASMLSSHQPWKASIWKFARALEDAFILNMATWYFRPASSISQIRSTCVG